MSEDIPKSFVDKIIERDRQLREKISAEHGESEELYKLYKERLDIYTTAEKMPVDPITKVLFSSMKSDVILEVAIFKLRKDFDEQISQIISRLDSVENGIKMIKERLGMK